MAPVERSSVVNATAETIWKTCFEPMKSDSWDPDVKELQDVSGPCENGTTFIFVMNDGSKVPTALSKVEANRTLTFSGSILGGAMGFSGTVDLKPQDTDPTRTQVTYRFGLRGCVGGVFALLKSEMVVGGTEGGLANIVRMSEDAQSSTK